jgi:hypothetical protein
MELGAYAFTVEIEIGMHSSLGCLAAQKVIIAKYKARHP